MWSFWTATEGFSDIIPETCMNLDVAATVASGHHKTHCGNMWRHAQNRKHITYRNAAGGGPSYGTDNMPREN